MDELEDKLVRQARLAPNVRERIAALRTLTKNRDVPRERREVYLEQLARLRAANPEIK